MKVRGKRFLLNLPGTQATAAIVAEVQNTSSWKPGTDYEGNPIVNPYDTYLITPNTTLQISDCTRSISFSFDWNDDSERKNSLRKVDKMIEALTSFREGLEIEQTLFTERKKALDAKKKEYDKTRSKKKTNEV